MAGVPQPVVDMASRLAHAMNTTLDPMVSHSVRLEAYNLLEQAKENLEVAVECGFFMAHRDKEPVVRHLGLQLLEHAIKYKWNDLSVEQKVYIKILQSCHFALGQSSAATAKDRRLQDLGLLLELFPVILWPELDFTAYIRRMLCVLLQRAH